MWWGKFKVCLYSFWPESVLGLGGRGRFCKEVDQVVFTGCLGIKYSENYCRGGMGVKYILIGGNAICKKT